MAKAGKFSINMVGEKELLKKLETIAKKDAKNAIRKAMRAGSNVILKAAKARVPVDEGDLKKSLKVRVPDKKKRGEYTLRLMTDEGSIGTGEFFYARMLEYGTKFMPARPWLRPAFDASKTRATQTATKILADEIEKAGK